MSVDQFAQTSYIPSRWKSVFQQPIWQPSLSRLVELDGANLAFQTNLNQTGLGAGEIGLPVSGHAETLNGHAVSSGGNYATA